MRAQMEENEDLAILMKGLRGQNLRDTQFADDHVQLRLVEVYVNVDFLVFEELHAANPQFLLFLLIFFEAGQF